MLTQKHYYIGFIGIEPRSEQDEYKKLIVEDDGEEKSHRKRAYIINIPCATRYTEGH